MRPLIWKGAFFGPSLERVLCPLEFEIQIRIWTLWLGRASPTSVCGLSTATWECVLEKRKHPIFKECINWTAFTSVTRGNVHKSSEGRATLSFFLIATHCYSPCKRFLLFCWVACPCSIRWSVLVIPSALELLTFPFLPSDSIYCFKSLQVPVGVPESFCVRVTACLFFYKT